jgi:6-phosphogluconolactonase
MPTKALRTSARLSVVTTLLWALTSCSTSTPSIVCGAVNNSSSGVCKCGTGTQACPITPGPEFLYATTIGQILAFSIDHNTGALTALGSATGPSVTLYPIASVNNQFLYVPDALNAQLDGFSINQTTGALTSLGSPFSTGGFSLPGGLASPAGSSLLYAADVSRVDAFTISASGTPTALSGPFVSGGNRDLAADPSGKFLYASDLDPPGGVFAVTIDSAGALTAVPDSPFTVPQTLQNSQPRGIVDTGSYVYLALSGTNQIAAFSIVSGTGALAPVPSSPFSAGTSPTNLAYSSGFLYATNLGDGTISGYSVSSSSGALTPLEGSPFPIVGGSLAADSLGEYLYASEAGDIQAFSINSSSGALTPVSGSPFPANGALNLTVVQIPPP